MLLVRERERKKYGKGNGEKNMGKGNTQVERPGEVAEQNARPTVESFQNEALHTARDKEGTSLVETFASI